MGTIDSKTSCPISIPRTRRTHEVQPYRHMIFLEIISIIKIKYQAKCRKSKQLVREEIQCSLPTSRFSTSRTSLIRGNPLSPRSWPRSICPDQKTSLVQGFTTRSAEIRAAPPSVSALGCIPGQDQPFQTRI